MSLYEHIDLDNGFLQQPFSEFIITTIPKDGGTIDRKSINTKNSLYLGNDFDYDSLLKKDSLNNGLVKTYSTSGADYLLFGRRYQFEYVADNAYACEIVLIGLVDGTTYNKATRELDPWVIAMLLTFLLISLFGLPFFKMIFISGDERVFSRDIIAAGFAVVVGASLVIVIFMSLMHYGYKYNVTLKDDLEKMGKTISNRLKIENDQNVRCLYEVELADYNENEFDSIKPEHAQLVENFKFIITIDKSGNILKKINLIKEPNGFPENIADREYVRDFMTQRNRWRISETGVPEDKEIKYVMRPVVSIESREEEAVYIIEDKNSTPEDNNLEQDNNPEDSKTNESEYRVASAQLSSIHLPVIPFGFQYAIIDDSKNGDVWFHSQPGKSSLEEFFKVSRNANDLRAAIYARVETRGRLNYHGSNFLYFITPIRGTNLNVIMLYDLALLRLQTSEVLSITAIVISIVFAIVGLICLLTVILRGRKTRLYKKEQFIFNFLTPRDSYKNRYLFLTLSFAILTPLCLAFGLVQNFNPFPAFLGSLLAVVWSYILVYYVLYHKLHNTFKFYMHNTLFLFAIVGLNTIIWYHRTADITVFWWAIALQGLCLAFIILSQYALAQKIPKQRSGLDVDTVASKEPRPRKVELLLRYGSIKFPFSLARTYSFFLFSWFLAAAIVPTIIIYLKAEEFNELIWVKTDHIYMSRAYMAKQKKLEQIIPRIDSVYLKEEYERVYAKHLDKGKYMANKYSLSDTLLVGRNQADKYNHVKLFQDLLWSTRPIFNEKIRNYKGMVYQSAADLSWTSTDEQAHIELTTQSTHKSGNEIVSEWPENETSKEGQRESYNFLPYLWVYGILTLLGLMYAMIYFYTNRFYGFRFRYLKPVNFDINKKIDYAEAFGKILSFNKGNSGVLLVGLPFSGKRSFAEKIVKASEKIEGGQKNTNETKGETAHLSFLKLDDVQKNAGIETILNSLSSRPLFTKHYENWDDQKWKHAKYFIVENLEHGLMSFELNNMKLKVISYLIAHKKRLVITSEVYPNQILAIYKPFLGKESYQDENSLISDNNSWRNIFGAFPQILVGMTDQKDQVRSMLEENIDQHDQVEGSPLKKDEQKMGPIKVFDKIPDRTEIVKEIANEVGYSQFLPRLAPIMMAKYADTRFDEQSMVLHVQKLSHGYYTDIWNALPARERYMLYDLAKDGFMNIKNGNSLFSLMKKGLIVWRNRPVVFNQSFQNFILSFVSKKEALKLEIRNRKDGSWATIKIVMYLMIITLVVFILLGEPGLLEDFEELLAALGGLGVILPVLSNVLGKSGEK